MKSRFFHFTLYATIVYLACTTLNLAVAAPTPSEENQTHFCGFDDCRLDNRRYARVRANLKGDVGADLNVGEPRTVRMIYFLPNDRPFRAEVVQRMKDEIRNIQAFFAEQMGAHGYGNKTFRVETDPQGEPMVHRVDGQHPDSYYIDNPGPMFDEIERAFNLNANIYLIVIDNSGQNVAENATGIAGTRGRSGGFALVNEEFSRHSAGNLATHELGHAFGLGHDFRDGAYILSYGSGASIGPAWSQLSACHAEFLAVHPYFNPDTPIEEGELPTIELISPRRYPASLKSVPVQLKVSSSEGLHQVLLSGSNGLVACRGLAGEKDAVVEFDYDGRFGPEGFTSLSDSVIHSIHVEVVDTDGNSGYESFSLAEISPHHIGTLPHAPEVNSVSFSRDGTTLASGSRDGTVKLWNVETQQDIGTFPHTSAVTSISFSPDGTTLVSGLLDGTVKLWNVETQQDIGTLPHTSFTHTFAVTSISFSPDGTTLVSGSLDGTVKLWDVETQQDIGTLPHTSAVTSISFSPDGTTLVSGLLDGTVKLWDVETQQDIGTLPHGTGVSSVSFSPDGTTLASGGGGMVKLWDVETQQDIGTLPHGTRVSSVSFSRDGTTLAFSWDRTVKLWDVTTGVSFVTLPHIDWVRSVAFSSDGTTLASGTEAGTVELWDASGWMGARLEAVAEIDISDPNLRAAIAEAIGVPPSATIFRGNMAPLTGLNVVGAGINNLTGLEGATNLKVLWLTNNDISDISVLVGLTKLMHLNFYDNDISDISVLAGLTNLTSLGLGANNISDISPLVANTGLGSGDEVYMQGNLLSYASINTHIPTLQSRGVTVEFDNRTPTRLVKISGDQHGSPAALLPNPLVVEVWDKNGKTFAGAAVTFSVTAGGGKLNITSTMTDVDGRAESTLTLGPNLGTNTVEVSAAEIEEKVTFTAVASEGVIIPDANLHAAVGLTLGKASGDRIVPSEVAMLTNLDARHSDIGDLTGLEFATNLTWLDLEGNNISDISAVMGLTKLTSLSLSNNSVSDISAVSGLTNLTELNLYDNNISDISSVADLTKLTELNLGDNNISDISAAAGLTNLTELNLYDNNISDISAVAGLTNLTELNLYDNNISDISSVADLTKLTELNLGDNNISDISAAAGLTNLTELNLYDNNISDISSVADLTKLTVLQLRQNNISDISAVAGLTNLTELNLYTNWVSDISPVAGLTNLTWLSLGFNNISDISVVAGLTKLTYLYLYGNWVSDISPVAGLTNLTWLSLGLNNISDISAVSGLINLTSLDLYGNWVSDISPLVANTGLGSGDTVYVTGNPLSYLSIKTHIPTLQSRGVTVYFDDQAHPALLKTLGDNQRRMPGETLANPFVVEAQDEKGSALVGISVTFTVTEGGGALSIQTTATDTNGRAESTLTLGPNLGPNTVEVSATGIKVPVTFNAEGVGTPTRPLKLSGDDQQGPSGTQLAEPFVVEVRDQYDNPLPDVEVTFKVTAGGGTLSPQSTKTDADGRAESTLTLGPNLGTNTVEVSAAEIEEKVTFTAVASEGVIIPDANLHAAVGLTLGKASGDRIVPSEVAMLTNLDARHSDIGDLTGLEFATNLTWLDLEGNNISDISAVMGLTKLTSLSLSNNSVSDISAVSGLTNLTELNLYDNNISDISSVVDLTKLTELNLGDNNISDISAAAGLTNLTELNLYDNNISDISSVADLTKLTVLQLRQNNISDISAVAGLTNLTELNLYTNWVSDISPVAGLTNLTWLSLGFNNISDISVVAGLTKLTYLYLYGNWVSDISPVAGLTNLTWLSLGLNNISDISAVSGLINLTSLDLYGNWVSDISPLVANTGLGSGDTVYVTGNPLSYLSIKTHIPTLQSRGVTVYFDDQAHPALLKTLGDNQRRMPGETLANPFVVEAQDEKGSALVGISVTFTVTEGGGALSIQTTATDTNGRAESTLTLGPNLGPNTVEVSATGIKVPVTFNAEGVGTPTRPLKLSGDDQQGPSGTQLAEPFVVEVRDQYDNPLPDVEVTFKVTAGGGTLSPQSTKTDADGRAESTLTLGSNPGINTVSVFVAGIEEVVTFNAIGEIEFNLSVPEGISLIHVPLQVTAVDRKPKTIESIGDLYDALGGSANVNVLITYNTQKQRWNSYLGDQYRGRPSDKALTDDLGIVASMKAAKSMLLSGDALGTNGNSSITLHPGTNLVGVPLRDSRITRVSDLFALEGIGGNVSVIIVSNNGEFQVVARAGDAGDIPITGGGSFILTARDAETVVIEGGGWYNRLEPTAASPMTLTGIKVEDTTPVLAVSGSIVSPVGGASLPRPSGWGFRVTVKNLSTGKVDTAVTDDNGVGYQFTFVNTETGRAAQVGDILEITAQSPDPFVGVQPLRYVVTPTDVKRNHIPLDELVAYEIPEETELLLNYPNPFNPETWIPYRLAEDAFVRLTIYDLSGGVIRRLDVGLMIAAVYESRAKAIYWDGRNGLGERVASGIYFYHLSAGDYSATRKMVISK